MKVIHFDSFAKPLVHMRIMKCFGPVVQKLWSMLKFVAHQYACIFAEHPKQYDF